MSLERLSKLLVDFTMDKFFQVSDWSVRPIPEDMLAYARCDSHFLIPMYLTLMSFLNPFLFLNSSKQQYMSPSVTEMSRTSPNDWLSNLAELHNQIQHGK